MTGMAGSIPWRAASGRAGGLAATVTLGFVVFVLNISFRVRETGDVGLDWQNGTKLATWAAILAMAAIRLRDVAPLFRDPVLALATAYAALALASSAWSPVPAYTAANAVGVLAYLALAALVAIDLGEDGALRVLTGSLSALMALSLLAGVVAPDIAYSPPSDVETVYRLQGFSGHPNVLGQQAAVLCLVAVAGRRTGALGRTAFLVALGLGIAAALGSGSRFAMAAFLVSWAFVALRRRSILSAVALPTAALTVVLVTLLSIVPLPDPDAMFGNLSRTGSSSEILTLTGRTELWAAAFERIMERPILGWGFNGTEGLLADGLPRNFAGSAVNAHNMIVQTLLSLGFVGSLPAFGLLALLVARAALVPDDLRDHVTAFVLVNGIGEVEIFGTPVLLTLVAYWAMARHAQSRRDPSGAGAGRAVTR